MLLEELAEARIQVAMRRRNLELRRGLWGLTALLSQTNDSAEPGQGLKRMRALLRRLGEMRGAADLRVEAAYYQSLCRRFAGPRGGAR